MNYTTIRILLVVVLAASVIVVGANLTSLQAYALSHRSQHVIQGNLCYRSNECHQHNVGQNTQGNDNLGIGIAEG